MTLLALTIVPILMHPVSRYRAAVGVELGTAKILLSKDLSKTSSSSKSVVVSLYHTSEFVRTELRKMLSLNKKYHKVEYVRPHVLT